MKNAKLTGSLLSPFLAFFPCKVRLNREKQKRFLPSRIKLDPFHWQDRYARVISKTHVLFGLFMACLRDALFFLDVNDVASRREKMVQSGMDRVAVERIPKSFFTRRSRCRRSIPPRLELAVRVQSVFEIFEGLVDSDGTLLITDKVKAKHAQCMEHIWAGCLSDIAGLPMYFERSFEGGLSVFGTLRGTSQLESYHRWLRACISGSRLCPDLFVDLLAHFTFRWNVRCGIRSRGDEDHGTYSHWLLESVLDGSGHGGALKSTFVAPLSTAQCETKRIDLNSVGFHMPTSATTVGVRRPDNENVDDDSCESDALGDDSSDDDDETLPINLAELQKSVAGQTRQAPIDAYSPVSDIREMSLLMELVAPFVVRGRGGSNSIRYEGLACTYNAELQKRFALDKVMFQQSGLRMKSAAHVREFFERTDRGLEIGQAIAPVRDRFIELRTMLRDCTSASIPTAMQPKSCVEDCFSTFTFASGACCDDSGIGSSKPKRKARSCKTCDSQGRGDFWKLRQIGSKSNTRFVCTNTVCELYEYDDRTSLLKSKSKRCCIHCRAAGLGKFHLRQTGSQANSQYHCLNPNCTLLTGKRAAEKEVGPDVEQVGLGNEMRDVDD